MKKLFLGIVIGFMLAIPTSLYAEEIKSYIGATIEGQFPVYLNGGQVEKPGLVIEGTTYLPVRTLGDLLGFDVSFIDSEVLLTSQEPEPTMQTMETSLTEPIQEDGDTVETKTDVDLPMQAIDLKIRDLNIRIDLHEAFINNEENKDSEIVKQKQIDLNENRLKLEYWQNIKSQKEALQ